MSVDKCRPVVVDGEVIRVLGGREMSAADREAFAEIVRAAKRRMSESVPMAATPSEMVPMASQDPLENPESILTRDTHEGRRTS
jgi:hypothetical protein